MLRLAVSQLAVCTFSQALHPYDSVPHRATCTFCQGYHRYTLGGNINSTQHWALAPQTMKKRCSVLQREVQRKATSKLKNSHSTRPNRQNETIWGSVHSHCTMSLLAESETHICNDSSFGPGDRVIVSQSKMCYPGSTRVTETWFSVCTPIACALGDMLPHTVVFHVKSKLCQINKCICTITMHTVSGIT